MRQLFWIALGSGLGSSLRYAFDLAGSAIDLGGFPVATFSINLTGSLLIGFLAGLWAAGGAAAPHPYKWHFWMTGVCGGYTTFSAFSWQTLDLLNKGQAQLAAVYAGVSIIAGFCAVALGLAWAGSRSKSRET